MGSRYVEPQNSRFITDRVDGIEQIRIPYKRNWFTLIFLSVWLTGWTIGGIVAAGALILGLTGQQVFSDAGSNLSNEGGNLFLFVWLIFWAFGWIFAATTVALQLGGSEILKVAGRDLEISSGVGRWRRRKLYRGDQIRNLTSSDPNPMGWPFGARAMTFPGFNRAGAIKFDYGARTIRAAGSVDESEGRMIVQWLKPKLPRTATE
jgi:hypothetical protein